METHRRVQSAVGNVTWITEFTPIEYMHINFFILLLQEFFERGICCAIVGTFPTYLAGVFSSFDRLILAVAVTTSSFLQEILQRNRTPDISFRFGKFRFFLERKGVDYSHYKVILDGVVFLISIHLFDSENCGRGSNLNFINYSWDNYLILPCRKYSIVILETEFLKHPRIYYLKHYRAGSDGWTARLYCNSCISNCKRAVQNDIFGCNLSDECRCIVCLRQPLTLKSLASHSVFQVLYNLDRFVLTATTAYEEYKFAIN
jgi:hypothetical protein